MILYTVLPVHLLLKIEPVRVYCTNSSGVPIGGGDGGPRGEAGISAVGVLKGGANFTEKVRQW